AAAANFQSADAAPVSSSIRLAFATTRLCMAFRPAELTYDQSVILASYAEELSSGSIIQHRYRQLAVQHVMLLSSNHNFRTFAPARQPTESISESQCDKSMCAASGSSLPWNRALLERHENNHGR
ncbi:MAG: hypothetical protein K2Y05_10850, partial [Hyphomicrobiaceae bacterium]|nr:hypothetical protein [Hyphomicrobiaceae bacterium]